MKRTDYVSVNPFQPSVTIHIETSHSIWISNWRTCITWSVYIEIMGIWKKLDATPVAIYLLNVNNKNIRTRCVICSKLTVKTPERRHWYIVNFQHISSSSFIDNFEHIAGWNIGNVRKKDWITRQDAPDIIKTLQNSLCFRKQRHVQSEHKVNWKRCLSCSN